MTNTKDRVVAAQAACDYGDREEGMMVGAIDTGLAPEHGDMVLSESTDAAHAEESVAATIDEHDLTGQFYTDKVPYGYNYMDENDEILDTATGASMHGMHEIGRASCR